MGLNPVPDILNTEGLRVNPAGVDAGCLIFRYQLVRVGGLGKTRRERHGYFRALQLWGEVLAQLVDQFNAFRVGHQGTAGEGIAHDGGLQWQKKRF